MNINCIRLFSKSVSFINIKIKCNLYSSLIQKTTFNPPMNYFNNARTIYIKSNLMCIKDQTEERESGLKEEIKMIFKNHKGEVFHVKAEIGKTVYEVAKAYAIAMEGSCNGQNACSTCHVYVDEKIEDALEPPTTEEDDLIDKAAFPQANSRLACQLRVKKELEGGVFTLPKGTVNFYVDGHVPEHH